jgi:hypothetical protein
MSEKALIDFLDRKLNEREQDLQAQIDKTAAVQKSLDHVAYCLKLALYYFQQVYIEIAKGEAPEREDVRAKIDAVYKKFTELTGSELEQWT